MTKQELEKAIENGESVWYVLDNGAGIIESHWGIREFDMFDKDYVIYYDEYCYRVKAKIQNFYETKAEAEHYLHHANVTRTETLPFLTWEEFKKQKQMYFQSISGNMTTLYIVENETPNIELADRFGKIKIWDLTEANFYKAYDECVRLFRGGE